MIRIVTPRYFAALRLPLLAGRVFDQRDTSSSPAVVVVNQSFVKAYSPGEYPLGKRILVERIAASRRALGPMTSWEIIGVVADEKADGLDQPQDDGLPRTPSWALSWWPEGAEIRAGSSSPCSGLFGGSTRARCSIAL